MPPENSRKKRKQGTSRLGSDNQWKQRTNPSISIAQQNNKPQYVQTIAEEC